jgi:hypothetical protein
LSKANRPRNAWLEKIKAKTEAPRHLEVRYHDRDGLAILGPMLQAMCAVPPALADLLQAAGRPVPSPVLGLMLIDTGAAQTCIAMDVARELGLKAVDLRRTGGVHGVSTNEVFEVYVALRLVDSQGVHTTMRSVQPMIGVPNLRDQIRPEIFQTSTAEHPKRLIGLLGRDFLRHTTMVYRGSKGIVEIAVDPGSFI